MLSQRNPWLRRIDVVSNSSASGISDATKEFSRTSEVSFSEIVSQPRMFLQKFKGTITFKQLKGFADAHSGWHFNKQVDVINSDVKFVNLKPFSVSNLSDEEFTIHSNTIEFHRIHGIFAFPHEVENILSKAMFSRFQIHFSSPKHSSNYVHGFISGGLESSPSDSIHLEILNFEDGDSSQNLKDWVSSPWM
ncbi:MAG: hypothetical protein ABIH65_03115 [Nanoarchaeota archaeon]